MLTLVLGRAGTGKTAYVMGEIRRRMDLGESDLLLIVPEQYSHDAERQLCAACGDALSLCGETLSFTRLCTRVFFDAGVSMRFLDDGGQTLVMHRALESVASQMKVFGTRVSRVELLEKMLEAIREFKILNIQPKKIAEIADRSPAQLADKLSDISLIYDAYEAILSVKGGDTADRLTLLSELVGESTVGESGHIYFDGFNDFSAQELRVIEELLRKDAEMTVCLTCDPDDGGEVFELPRKTVDRLRRLAERHGVEVGIKTAHSENLRAPELSFMERNLFDHAPALFPAENKAIAVYSAPTRYVECEFAANKVWELVRAGHRWRDIGVVARDWSEYGPICENIFDKSGIPFFSSGRADIFTKPPAALIEAALDIAVSGFEYRKIFRYIKTGLAGIGSDECAELENYVLKWNIRGTTWAKEWVLPPSGYGGEKDESTLARINKLRRRVSEPLFRLRDGLKGVSEAEAKLRSLYSFLEDIELPETLNKKAANLESRGEKRLSSEYVQLWDVISGAMEQIFGILGETKLSAAEFKKVFSLVLSSYDVGVIPVSLDRTALGGMAMSRRRDLKSLIVLGATDENMPMLTTGGGVLSDADREEMGRLGAEVPAGLEERLCREMNILYSTITLPSNELIVTYPASGGGRPSFIVKRLREMFGLSGQLQTPPFLSATVRNPGFRTPDRADARLNRGNLSNNAAEKLYGRELSLSATRADRYYSCPYQHFLQSGLRLHPRIPAEFDAPLSGNFMHFMLENVSKEIKDTAGFRNADRGICEALTARYAEQYVCETLYGLEGKNARFVYLFRRIEEDVMRIVLDTMAELKSSEFEPLDFELDLSKHEAEGIKGYIDRVDGWEHGGKLYIRVIDYKTGRKSFDLSEITYGRNMQLLIYLFALQKTGRSRYGGDVEPAGVLYVPARGVISRAPRGATDEELAAMRDKELRRGGLILDDPAVLNAMESGDEKRYLPVKNTKDGAVAGDSLVSKKQIKALSEHVRCMLSGAVEEILDGKIECSPYYKSDADNACMYCEYTAVCCFDEEVGDKRRFVRKLSNAEIWEKLRKLS